LLLNPELLASKLAEQAPNETGIESEIARVDKQIHEIQRKEGKLLEAMLEGDIPLPGIRTKAKELEGQRQSLERAAENLASQLRLKNDRAQLRDTVRRYCQALAGRLPNLDLLARQKLLRALLDEVVVKDGQVTLKGILPTPLYAGKPYTTS
jgi:chromosome segregation ATPase